VNMGGDLEVVWYNTWRVNRSLAAWKKQSGGFQQTARARTALQSKLDLWEWEWKGKG